MPTDLQTFEKRMNGLLHVEPGSTAVLTVDIQRDYLDLEIASSPVLESEAERVLPTTTSTPSTCLMAPPMTLGAANPMAPKP